jgi:hypothetical protein
VLVFGRVAVVVAEPAVVIVIGVVVVLVVVVIVRERRPRRRLVLASLRSVCVVVAVRREVGERRQLRGQQEDAEQQPAGQGPDPFEGEVALRHGRHGR